MSHQTEADTHMGDIINPTPNQSVINDVIPTGQSASYQREGKRANLMYREDLGYLPLPKDPRSS